MPQLNLEAAKQLRWAACARGYTPESLAAELGLSWRVVAHAYEWKGNRATPKVYARLCKHLGIEPLDHPWSRAKDNTQYKRGKCGDKADPKAVDAIMRILTESCSDLVRYLKPRVAKPPARQPKFTRAKKFSGETEAFVRQSMGQPVAWIQSEVARRWGKTISHHKIYLIWRRPA